MEGSFNSSFTTACGWMVRGGSLGFQGPCDSSRYKPLPLAGARNQSQVLLACLGISLTEDELASLKQVGEKDIEVTSHRLR